jgi:hypothetical protein
MGGARNSSNTLQVARTERSEEMGSLKTHHRFERMRLRGLSGARDEFHLAAIVQNQNAREPLLATAAKQLHA